VGSPVYRFVKVQVRGGVETDDSGAEAMAGGTVVIETFSLTGDG
jgi:hypothetical protein